MTTTDLQRIGILYPGHAAEDDFAVLNERLGGGAVFDVVHTSIGEDAHREDALLEMGSSERLLEGARRLAPLGTSAVVWACTSGSFIYGWEGAQRQTAELEEVLDLPVSSTSLAYVNALRTLGLRRVAIAATYPQDIARCFAAFLTDAGLEPVAVTSHGIVTAAEVGTMAADGAAAIVNATNSAGADAVLLPDTALHTIASLEALEEAAGKPVLTANQVSAWEGLRLAGAVTKAPGLGQLFAASPRMP